MAFPGWQLLRNRTLGTFLSFAAGSAAAPAFTPPFRDLTAELETRFGGTRRLSPADLAELVVRGAREEADAAREALEEDVNGRRFHELYLLSGNPPGPETLIELWNRGAIDEGDVERGVRQGRIRTEWLGALKQLRHRLLTPAESAEAVARGLQGDAEGRREAASAGIDAARFDTLRRLASHPPAVGQVLELVNRGRMNPGAARAALLDAGVRADYVDDVLELRRYLIPPGDLIRLAVREVYTPELRREFGLDQDFPPEFAARAAKLGIDLEEAGDLWAGHWNLPSAEQGFAMLHRGIIERPRLVRLLRALDYMPGWRDELIRLAFRLPGRIDLRRMFRFGTIDRERLARGYRDLGYAPEVVGDLVRFAVREKMGAERDLAKGEVVALYGLRRLDRGQAIAELAREGYDETEAARILELADARKARERSEARKREVRARFLDREITREEARARMELAGLPAEEIEEELEAWTWTLAENPRHITEAQGRALWKAGRWDEARYRQHLAQLGIPEDEAGDLVWLYSQAPAP